MKWEKDLEEHFSKEDIKMPTKHMERCSAALVTMSGQVSRGSAGEYQADERQVWRDSPGEYQADERAGVA